MAESMTDSIAKCVSKRVIADLREFMNRKSFLDGRNRGEDMSTLSSILLEVQQIRREVEILKSLL